MEHLDSQERFERAIAAGSLSADPTSATFAGLYMYMGTEGGADLFKHIDTRRYLHVVSR